jgi:hypothetical protein
MDKNPEKNTNPLISTRLVVASLALAGIYIPNSTTVPSANQEGITVSANPEFIIANQNNIEATAPINLASGGPESGEGIGTKTAITYEQAPTFHVNTHLMEKNSKSMHIPAEARKFMNANTVYLSGIGCSGTIIRKGGEISGKPVGVAFAKHCGFIPTVHSLMPYTAARYVTGSNHKDYTIKGSVVAETGSVSNKRVSIGEITQVIVPQDSDNTVDIAFGILPGATAKEVLSSYKEESLSHDEITKKLIPGESMVYMRGWPENQRSNKKGDALAQEFAMPYLGTISTYNAVGEALLLIMTAVPKVDSRVDDATCSFGASGSGGFIINKDKARLIGTLSGFWGMSPLAGGVDTAIYNNSTSPKENRQYFKSLFPNIDWNNYSAVCGFSYEFSGNYKVVNMVPSLGDVPGHIQSVTDAIYHKQELFVDPKYTRTIVDGTVIIDQEFRAKNGELYSNPIAIKRPIIEIDQKTGRVFIGYYSGEQPGVISVISAPNVDNLTFYQNNPTATIVTKKSTGEMRYVTEPVESVISGSLVDDTGLHFGEYDNYWYSTANKLTTPYALKFKNNEIQFVKMKIQKTPAFLDLNNNQGATG